MVSAALAHASLRKVNAAIMSSSSCHNASDEPHNRSARLRHSQSGCTAVLLGEQILKELELLRSDMDETRGEGRVSVNFTGVGMDVSIECRFERLRAGHGVSLVETAAGRAVRAEVTHARDGC